jgi:squalene-hopene/tetraprenyl-beta-curcumene cyclase
MSTSTLDRTIATLTRRLLQHRAEAGHWEGHLASSALSTATACVALTFEGQRTLVRPALRWLTANQNRDGGWGDTVISLSNLSTTLLVWSALSLDTTEHSRPALERGERWLRDQLGEVTPERLRNAIIQRYGKDRTFSVPILTVLALTGKLGPGRQAWRLVPQLPFELAACPHQWFRWLRLPVVSYALPALVAIGQVRHRHAPTRNPLFALLRSSLRSRTIAVARDMQPPSGGYLEAIPLTAFVSMALIRSGAANDEIVTNGIRFLVNSARADGSWPIDTNLATWVTTLSVSGLDVETDLTQEDRHRILQWLLDQQVSKEHPFTHARPGGWAWTDLSGGVPDADDTAGALLAIWKLAGPAHVASAVAGLHWLLEIQNADGGIPTFCRGWGALPFDRSAPDLTAHALEAWSAWAPAVPPNLQSRISKATNRAISYLTRQQRADGSWAPLWFGNERAPDEVNLTYGTARVVGAPIPEESRRRGVDWLLRAQNSDGGWGGAPGVPSSIEETGLALAAVSRHSPVDAISRAVQWLVAATDEGHRTPPSPIGFYFARLWYYEQLYPLVFALRGLRAAAHSIEGLPRLLYNPASGGSEW